MTIVEGRTLEVNTLVERPVIEQMEIEFPRTSQSLVSPEIVTQLGEVVAELGEKALECAGLSKETKWNYLIVTPKSESSYISHITIDKDSDQSYVIHDEREKRDNAGHGSFTHVKVDAYGNAIAEHYTFNGEHSTYGDEPASYLIKKLGNCSCEEVTVLNAGRELASV